MLVPPQISYRDAAGEGLSSGSDKEGEEQLSPSDSPPPEPDSDASDGARLSDR